MEKKKKIAVAFIGGSVAVLSGATILYWLNRRKLEELEERERLEEEQKDDYEKYERGYALMRLRRDPRRVPLTVLQKYRYENEIEKRELTERNRRKSPIFNVIKTPYL